MMPTNASERHVLEPGSPQPLGANWTGRGTNFAVFSAHAERVELCLFDASGRTEIARLELPSRTGNLWHGFLPARFGGPGLLYGYRVHGPYEPARGHRFNPAQAAGRSLRTVAARGISTGTPRCTARLRGRDEQRSHDDSAPFVPRAEVVDGNFDWGRGRSPNVPWRDTIIYEVHVKGFTQNHPDVPPELRGTYLGLAQPAVIEWFKRLGVTTIELMPVQAFVSEQFLAERGLSNYWGYNSLAWFAPEPRYAVRNAVLEFKTMVRALHEAGLEVILDVVFNHTAEGNEHGPTLSLRGFDNCDVLPVAAAEPRPLRELLGLRQHDQLRRAGGAGAGGRLPALLGHRDARRRLPLRPRADPRAGRARLPARFAVLRRPALGSAAGLSQDDRRALGRRPRRLPARAFPGRLVGVERSLPRHGPRVLARRPPAGAELRRAVRGLERPLPRARAQADGQHQLRRGARRLHAARYGRLRPPAQRGQPRGQPRRARAQPECQLRRRRARPTDPAVLRPAPAPGAQPAGDAVPVAGRADAAGGRRVRPDAARQQQCLLPGQRHQLDRLELRRTPSSRWSSSSGS